jgi:uncharacterized Zn-binding protein involved in type VI secretion
MSRTKNTMPTGLCAVGNEPSTAEDIQEDRLNRPLIVMGDKTTHGGTVIGADMTSDINGKYLARVNDMTVCPKCRGTFPITSGAEEMKDGAGNAYARHMDSTACGAKLISSQVTSYWGSESSMGAGASAGDTPTQALPAAVAAQTPTLCLECLAAAAARGDGIVPRG